MQSIIIFGKVLMRSDIGLDNFALLSFGKFKKKSTDVMSCTLDSKKWYKDKIKYTIWYM